MVCSVTDIATKIIKYEEGFKPNVYLDSKGYPTIGYGLLLSKEAPIPADFPSMPESVASLWASELLEELVSVISLHPSTSTLDPVRAAVCSSMAYQLGLNGFLGFHNTLVYLKQKDFDAAAEEMLDSLWAEQTPERAQRHAAMIRTGVLLKHY